MTDATQNGSYQLTDRQRMNLNALALHRVAGHYGPKER